MKKVIVSIIFLLITNYLGNSHNERNVHQRIVIEAYKLLKIQLSMPGGIADIENYISAIFDYKQFLWHNVKTLNGGAMHEDIKDIVFGKDGLMVSSTHFWDADNPTYWVRISDIFAPIPSAYVKACNYINDTWFKDIKIPHSGGYDLGYKKMLCYGIGGLYKWYSRTSIYVKESYNVYGGFFKGWGGSDYNWTWVPSNSLFCKEMFFNVLGRLCHLLTDMGVPEHAKKSMHLFKDSSPYEDWIGGCNSLVGVIKDPSGPDAAPYINGFSHWTAENIYKERGGFVNPFCVMKNNKGIDDPNLYLFYTTAQLSDWFISYGSNPRSGNDNFSATVGEIKSIIDSYMPSQNDIHYNDLRISPYVSGVWDSGWHLPEEVGDKFNDVLLPYTIRAVAGLLYRYIIEAKMQHPDGTLNRGTIYNQQLELELYSQDLSGDYYTFRAEGDPGKITVCPGGDIPITMNFFTIESRARNVTFRAANEIVFKEGFTIKAGAEMHAYLSPCSDAQQTGNCKECLDEDFNPQYNRRQ